MTVYHIAPDGSDSNSGSKSEPFATFEPVSEKGSHPASPDDTIKIHGGTISIDAGQTGVFWDVPGLTVEAYDDQTPVIDATSFKDRSSSNIDSKPILWFGRSENATVRGLEIANAPAAPVRFEMTGMDATYPFSSVDDMKIGGYVVDCTFHHCGMGLKFTMGRGGVAERVESYGNFGPLDESLGSTVGGDSDGIVYTTSPSASEPHRGGAVIGCSLHHNSDDGVDLFRATGVLIRDSVAYSNGYMLDGTKAGEAPGKGFKIGGTDSDFDTGGSVVYRCAAWDNGAPGIGLNGANLPCDIWNCTLFGNARVRGGDKDIELYTVAGPSGELSHRSTLYNNVTELGVWPHETALDADRVKNNNFGVSGAVQTAFRDFDFVSVETDSASNPTDWSTFLQLNDGSIAIDSGTDTPTETSAKGEYGVQVPITFEGSIPDLGAYEYVATQTDTSTPAAEYGGYSQPQAGTLDWHIPMNENFAAIEEDIKDLARRIENLEG
jgi:hypothetical protein